VPLGYPHRNPYKTANSRTITTGEPCASKDASTVRRGADGKGLRHQYLAGSLPYVLDFYHYWYRFHPQFWQRLGLGWNDADKALERYGVVQEWVKEYESDARRGSGQTNIQVSTIPAPGLSAKLIPSLLEDLCYLTVLDVGAHMPPRMEFPEIVSMRDPTIEAKYQQATDAREQAKRALDAWRSGIRGEGTGKLTPEQQAAHDQLAEAYRVAAQQVSEVIQQQSPYHLAKHYGTLVGRLEDLAKERNQAARLAKGTVPRWFAVLPCDTPFEVWQTKRGDWGDEMERTCVVSTPTLAWDYLYPLEKRLIALVERERAEGRRIMLYYEQNELRSMAKRLSWVLQDFHPWTLPNKVASEDRQAAILDAVLHEGHQVILVPYRRVNEGLNLQSAVDTVIWVELAMNLFMLDQASRRAWRLGKREEVRIYYVTYAHTTGHSKLRRLGLQSGAAAAFAGEPARGALIHEAGADQTTLARLSSMLEADADDSLPQEMVGESEIAQEEVTLKAVFRRRAEELQATLKAGRQFLGGIEDTLEARLTALLGNPAFAAPVWADLPVHRLLVTPRHRHQPEPEQAPRIAHMEPHSRMPDPSILDPAPSTVAAEPQPPSLVAPTPPATHDATPTPTPVPLPAPTQTWVFGDQAHILLARRRAPRKQCGAVAHPKRRIPMIEREIPAFDEQAAVPANGSSRTASSVALPSLWDMLTAPTSLAAHTAATFPPLPAPRPPSTPRQTGLWD
jgi:hypothetical protein